METAQTERFASLEVRRNPATKEKGRRFLLSYRDTDRFTDISAVKLAVTIMDGTWEPTLVVNYAETIADCTREDVIDAFLARVHGDTSAALTVEISSDPWETAARCGLHANDYVSISTPTQLHPEGRTLHPALDKRLSYGDAQSLVKHCHTVGQRLGRKIHLEAEEEQDGSLNVLNAGEVIPMDAMAGWKTLREVADETGCTFAQMRRNAYDIYQEQIADWRARRDAAREAALAQRSGPGQAAVPA